MYIKLDLTQNLLDHIKIINYNLGLTYGSDFIAQELEEAGLGCHPYHITLVGKIHNAFNSENALNQYIDNYKESCTNIKIKPTNQVKITNRGNVLWLIDSHQVKLLGKYMCIDLNNSRVSNYCNSTYLHITLGIIKTKSLFNKTITMHDDLYTILDKEYGVEKVGWDY